MNILIASNDSVFSERPIGGAETSLSILAEELAQLGHKVWYLTNLKSKLPKVAYEQISANLTLVKVSGLSFLNIPLPGINKFIQRVKKRSYLKKVRQVITHHNTELVYVFGSMLRAIITVKEQQHLSFPVVIRVAGIHATKGKTPVKPKTDYLSKTDVLNYQSLAHKESYIETRKEMGLPIPDKKELIADIGIHPNFFRHAPSRDFTKNALRFICIMRFSARKRQDLLIEAFKSIPDNNTLTYVGDGSHKDEIMQLSQQAGLTNIQFVGHVPRPKLIELMAAHDVLLHPVDYEPQSKAVWEAMAMKLPVFCSKVASLSNYIEHEKTGYLIENTPIAWSKAIQIALENPALLKQLTNRAFLQVEKDASAGYHIGTFEKAFKSYVV